MRRFHFRCVSAVAPMAGGGNVFAMSTICTGSRPFRKGGRDDDNGFVCVWVVIANRSAVICVIHRGVSPKSGHLTAPHMRARISRVLCIVRFVCKHKTMGSNCSIEMEPPSKTHYALRICMRNTLCKHNGCVCVRGICMNIPLGSYVSTFDSR